MRAHRRFFGRPDQVREVRRFVERQLDQYGCPLRDEPVLLVSEIVTNALQHTASGAGGTFEVSVIVHGLSLRVEVCDDGGPSEPRLSLDDLDDDYTEDGRGLALVELLADRWGQAGDHFGRVVWFELSWKEE